MSHQEKEEDVLHGLKKGMEILVRWELIDDEVGFSRSSSIDAPMCIVLAL